MSLFSSGLIDDADGTRSRVRRMMTIGWWRRYSVDDDWRWCLDDDGVLWRRKWGPDDRSGPNIVTCSDEEEVGGGQPCTSASWPVVTDVRSSFVLSSIDRFQIVARGWCPTLMMLSAVLFLVLFLVVDHRKLRRLPRRRSLRRDRRCKVHVGPLHRTSLFEILDQRVVVTQVCL